MAEPLTFSMRGIAADELAKFQKLQKFWWDPNGPLRSLHFLNAIRVRYVNDVTQRFGKYGINRSFMPSRLIPGQHILDVGCGGGIFSESLARQGATVTGIDVCAESIAVAQQRLDEWRAQGLPPKTSWPNRLSYQQVSVFDLAEKQLAQFDMVMASEVIEHVSDAREFLQALCEVTKPGGLLVLTTMDKSILTAITHIALAEYVTGIVAPGTHDWRKFIPPKDMTSFAKRFDVHNVDLQYVVAYPDVLQTIASRNFQMNFCLSKTINTGHYFWTGLKATRPVSEQQLPPQDKPQAGKNEEN